MLTSISNQELKTARELNKQVYIFIDKNVDTEHSIYSENKENFSVNYKYVDNIKIHQFIDEIKSLSINNTISTFETADDIVDYLKEQWAGLFQRFLSEQTRMEEKKLFDKMHSTAKILDELVSVLSKEMKNSDDKIKEILFRNHPAFLQLQSLLKLNFHIIFNNIEELENLLKFLNFDTMRTKKEDPDYKFKQFSIDNDGLEIYVNKNIFEANGTLKLFIANDWNKDYITLYDCNSDLPF